MPELRTVQESGRKDMTYDLDNGEVVHYVLLTTAVTGDDVDRISAAPEEENAAITWEMLAKCISEWDITENGVTMPISVESFKQLPFSFSTKLIDQVMEILNPPEKSGGSFGNG